MQGFDPGDGLLMDQSIVVHADGADAGGAPFRTNSGGVIEEITAGAGYQPPQNLLPPNPDNDEGP